MILASTPSMGKQAPNRHMAHGLGNHQGLPLLSPRTQPDGYAIVGVAACPYPVIHPLPCLITSLPHAGTAHHHGRDQSRPYALHHHGHGPSHPYTFYQTTHNKKRST